MTISPVRLNHAVLFVADLDRSVRFYTDLFGMEVIARERRANAVRQRLVDLGVSPALLDTVSYGEARPAVQGSDESAWRWNRRAEFLASAQ